MAGGKRRIKRNPTAGGPRCSAGAGRRRSLPELPSFVSPTSVAAAFGPSSSGGRGRGRGSRRGGASPSAVESAHAVPFSYTTPLRPCSASSGGATEVLEMAIDTAPCADPTASVPMYSYDVVGGIGLGFNGDGDSISAKKPEQWLLHQLRDCAMNDSPSAKMQVKEIMVIFFQCHVSLNL